MKIINSIPPEIEKGEFVCLDVETFGQEQGSIHRPTGTFACLSICSDGKNVYQIYDEKQIKGTLKNLNKGIWVFHNSGYDLMQLRRFADIKPRFIWDTMLVEQSMNGGLYRDFALNHLSRRWLGEYMEKESRKDFETRTEMTAKLKTYAARDALKTLEIAQLQYDEYNEQLAFAAYMKIDEPAIFPILDLKGFPVNSEGWKTMIEEFQKKSDQLEDKLEINVNSSPQVVAAARKNGFQIKNAQAGTLEIFKGHPFIDAVLEAKMYRKAVSTYGLKWLTHVEKDGKVYCSYHITGAETGRMSSSSPNMQQIPVRRMPQYRTLFVASPKHKIVVSDVSQQEPRILAYESKDDALLEAFKSGEDLHYSVAKTIYGDFPKTHKDYAERRAVGKAINLGTSYGLSEFGLADKLNIEQEEAAGILRKYFSKFRSVFSWISLQRMTAHKNQYVKTAVGRKVFLNPYDHSFDNNAINAPIQGGAADLMKMWLRKIWEGCRKVGIEYPVVAIVHDEIVANVPDADVKKYKKLLLEAFQESTKTLYPGIPFEADTEQGRSWGIKQNKEEVEDDDGEE